VMVMRWVSLMSKTVAMDISLSPFFTGRGLG
jgi:hypothetical protein